MTSIDIMCGMMALYGFYLGYTRGIIKTVLTVLSIFFGIVAAAKFGPAMTDFLQSVFGEENGKQNPLMFLAGLMLAFLLTMALIRLLANGLEGILESANINVINQVLGGLVLSGVLVAIFSFLVRFGDLSGIIDKETKGKSPTYPFLKEMPEQLMKVGSIVRPVFSDFWEYSIDFMDRVKPKQTETNNVFEIEDRYSDEKTSDQ